MTRETENCIHFQPSTYNGIVIYKTPQSKSRVLARACPRRKGGAEYGARPAILANRGLWGWTAPVGLMRRLVAFLAVPSEAWSANPRYRALLQGLQGAHPVDHTQRQGPQMPSLPAAWKGRPPGFGYDIAHHILSGLAITRSSFFRPSNTPAFLLENLVAGHVCMSHRRCLTSSSSLCMSASHYLLFIALACLCVAY